MEHFKNQLNINSKTNKEKYVYDAKTIQRCLNSLNTSLY